MLASEQFLKSEKQNALLRYLSDHYLEGKNSELTEFRLAVDVFHRQPDKWCPDDSIVRVQIHELRKRLRTYYEGEGKSRPLRIDMPRGSYNLEVVRVTDEPTRPAFAWLRRARWRYVALGAVLVVSLVLNATLFLAPARSGEPAPMLADGYAELFGPAGPKGRETLFCLSNPSVLSLRSGTPELPRSFSQDEYRRLSPEDSSRLFQLKAGPVYIHPSVDEYTGMGEAVCAYKLGRLMERLNLKARLTQARFLNWDRASQDNLILLGLPANSGTWTRANFSSRLFRDNGTGLEILAQHKTYSRTFDPTGKIIADFGVISKETTASGAWVFVLAGNTSYGTYGIGEFLSDPARMEGVFRKLRSATRDGGFPQDFILLFEIHVRDNIPTDVSLKSLHLGGS